MEENKNSDEEKSAIGNEQLAENRSEEIISAERKTMAETEEPQIEQSEIPIAIGTTYNQQQTEENMEVHHHTHPDSHRDHGNPPAGRAGKNWKTYFWEFLMLFLAVFCGFLAEYQLEHMIEHQREKQFIGSFIEDLKSDTVFINEYVHSKIQKRKDHDSLIWYLNSPDPNRYSQRIYLYARKLTRNVSFIPADGTIKQLKNSGGLRLIRNQQASDSIMAYDQAIELVLKTQSRQENEVTEIRPMMGRLMNANVLETMVYADVVNPPLGNPPLRTVDKEFILDFIYAVHQLKGSDALNAVRLQRLKERAIGIILFLKKEYHLK
jgi:hypothetical protein